MNRERESLEKHEDWVFSELIDADYFLLSLLVHMIVCVIYGDGIYMEKTSAANERGWDSYSSAISKPRRRLSGNGSPVVRTVEQSGHTARRVGSSRSSL